MRGINGNETSIQQIKRQKWNVKPPILVATLQIPYYLYYPLLFQHTLVLFSLLFYFTLLSSASFLIFFTYLAWG